MKPYLLFVLLLGCYTSLAQGFQRGSKVEVEWSSGAWYPATIVDVSDSQFKVHLDGDGANTSRDQWIFKTKGIIRSAKTAARPATATATPTATAAASRPVATPVAAQRKQPASSKRVEVNESGHWYKATVLEQKGDLSRVHFDGYGSADDKWVHRSYIRSLTENGSAVTVNCSFTPPPGTFTNSSPASDALFKKEVYDWYNRLANGTLTRPSRIGVVFTYFSRGAAYQNTVTNVPGRGATRKHDGAPANATIYPVKMTFHVCEDYNGTISQKQVNSDFSFFIDRDGAWTCSKDN
ncbi:hypothetical protein HMJ29_00340 [Hymenobacter taeanensis]|uniref:Tudor domain-containing protein n=1 Tax=Hymenobacter taeanensis TaxID=2735321 RepID=A0A6M6BE51_9BACT|nr:MULTISPECIES: agenet domain-containing protein [Hymenobacter]QJX45465.1 hypothetical protein HMJ29_00340 [Hymenobacter taeanensis]UOQ81289.1 hypothetical protein MUN83_00365 [Hymenobacter sp. 5414T-23]